MLQRFLTLGAEPELRTEPSSPAKNIPEIEVVLPIEKFWELQELLRQLKYTRGADLSTSRFWQKLALVVKPYIVHEKDRLWFIKNIGT